MAHTGILQEGEPGIRPPGIFGYAGGLRRGGGEDAQQAQQQQQAQPRQGALQPGHPGGVERSGDGEEDATADQDHVGRKL
ncbi:hypothetical protein [Nitrosospira sp. Nsp5]|uniref:hypothetical protein n=1 Tax=Nitrosospira sp. Nsp5 TaxID=200119 RepID=UPI00215900C5|nr:hypothetical protein [Nitrosospira sp. Nsp5]